MYTQRILLHGHIIDSLTLPKTMDTIIDQGGDYEIEELQVGKLKTDKSTANLLLNLMMKRYSIEFLTYSQIMVLNLLRKMKK